MTLLLPISGKVPMQLQRPRVLPNRQLQGVDLGHDGLGEVRRRGGPDVHRGEPVLEAAQVRRIKFERGRGEVDLLRLAAERHCGQHSRELPRDVRHGAGSGQEQDRVPRLAQVSVLKKERKTGCVANQRAPSHDTESISQNNNFSHIANRA